MKKHKVRDRWQVALYVPKEMVAPLKREARRQNRPYSATVLEILKDYFAMQAAQTRIAHELETERAEPAQA